MKVKRGKQPNAEKPISLKPYKFDEAVSDLLKVQPPNKKPKTNKSQRPIVNQDNE